MNSADEVIIKIEGEDGSSSPDGAEISIATPDATGFSINTEAPVTLQAHTESLSVPFGHQNDMLKAEMPMFDFNNPPTDPTKLANKMTSIVKNRKALGLAANQIGLPYRVFVMQSDPFFVCFNPEITAYSDEEVSLDEACLSWPGVGVRVKRPKSIRCKFTDPYGNVCVRKFTGMAARVFQHELDHLNGITFIDRANNFHKERFRKKWKQVIRILKKRKLTSPASIQRRQAK